MSLLSSLPRNQSKVQSMTRTTCLGRHHQPVRQLDAHLPSLGLAHAAMHPRPVERPRHDHRPRRRGVVEKAQRRRRRRRRRRRCCCHPSIDSRAWSWRWHWGLGWGWSSGGEEEGPAGARGAAPGQEHQQQQGRRRQVEEEGRPRRSCSCCARCVMDPHRRLCARVWGGGGFT
jgi:hypothetical protein